VNQIRSKVKELHRAEQRRHSPKYQQVGFWHAHDSVQTVVNNTKPDRLTQGPVAAHKPKIPKHRMTIMAIMKVRIAVARWKLMVIRMRLIELVVGNKPVKK